MPRRAAEKAAERDGPEHRPGRGLGDHHHGELAVVIHDDPAGVIRGIHAP